MKNHHHNFDSVESYLHHRAPYLLVDEIVSITDTEIVTRKTVAESDFYIKGHFPGAPIMPGAMMQELSTQTAGILIAARYNPMETYNTADPFFNEYALGVLVKIKHARYKSFARLGDTLTVTVNMEEQVGSLFDFRANITVEDQKIMSNGFQLMNIESKTLQGTWI